ncbi:MAG TPA: hypothetical protein VE136_13165 [Anaerolineales bacterium]|jgi:hypothetical protein|nr:hypothetical protein [Anaerolineales bacterium]
MAKHKPGKRHTLLLYKRAMGRLWQATLFLGLILAGLWWQITSGKIPLIDTKNGAWVLVGAVVTLVFTLFALVARNMAYVQPYGTHIRLVTPFLRLQISYRRVRSVHPASFSKLFPPEERGWAEDQFLEPFYPMTVVVVELNAYPLPKPLLRLFLSRQMLASQGPGFIFLVEDWMALSTEIDTFLETYRRSRQPKQAIASPFRTRW